MDDTIRLTTAQALIKFLNNQYINIDGEETPFVEGIFTVFGHGNVLGIGEALEQDPGHLRVVQGKNEQGMTHAATAFAKQKLRKKIFASTASAGPGSANMITAAATAFANNIPVLLLPADTFASRQPDPVLQQLEHDRDPSLTTNDAFKSVSRYWDRIQRPEQLMGSLLKAFEVMTNPETAGPATICISQDTEAEAYDYPVDFFQKRVHYVDRREPTSREINTGSNLIKQSDYPVIIVGGGAKYSEAGEEIKQFSEQCNIPIVETHAGKSTVEYKFKNNLGGTGILGTSAANKAVEKSDLIIGVGTRYTDFITSSKTAYDYSKTKFLNINVSRVQSSKFDATQIVADAKLSIRNLSSQLLDYSTKFGTKIVELKEEWENEWERLNNTEFNETEFTPEIDNHFSQDDFNNYVNALETTFTQTAAFTTINKNVSDDAIVLASAGSLPGDMQRLWQPNKFNTYHLEYGYSCMGYEVSGALGAKMANPDKEVYAMVGDGSFLMLHSELITSIQENEKINIMLFDNSGFGCINNLQMSNGSTSYMTEFRTKSNEIMNIDYAKVAEGYGVVSYKVNNKEDLVKALQDAKKQEKSTLIEIKVLPKTMSDGYRGWWNVGVAEVSGNKNVEKAYHDKVEKMKQAKKY